MSNYLNYLLSIQTPQNFQRKLDYLKHNFSKYISNPNSDYSVLEIGPGLGEFTHYLNQLSINNIDIADNDTSIIDYIKSKYKIQNSYLIRSITDVDKQLSKYNLIFMLQVFEHIPKDEYTTTLQTLFKHLKPGGKLIITVPNGGNPLNLMERYSDITHQNLFSDNSLKEIPNLYNLDNCQIEVYPYAIPPYTLVNIIRIIFQKILHFIVKITLIINGGVYPTIYTPNISMIITKI